MPYYKMTCRECKKSESLLMEYEDMKKHEKKPCPKCGKKGLFQEINSANFVLKGSGWVGNSILGRKY